MTVQQDMLNIFPHTNTENNKGVFKCVKYLSSASNAEGEDIYQQKTVLSPEKEIAHVYTQSSHYNLMH